MSLCLCVLILVFALAAAAQDQLLRDRTISDVTIAFEGADRDVSAAAQFRLLISSMVGEKYSPVRVRDSLQTLYDSDKIVSAQVEASLVPNQNAVTLRFIIRRKTQAEKVNIEIVDSEGDNVTEAQLLLRLNLMNPGTAVTEQTLRNNADLILSYLRDRGFYNAEVTYTQAPLAPDTPTRVGVTFRVNPKTQARVERFNVNITGFNQANGFDVEKILRGLDLRSGEFFSQRDLEQDVQEIRQALIKENYLAASLGDPRVTFDPDKNTVAIELAGTVGPKVNVVATADDKEISRGTLEKNLPIISEGTLDQAAIIEGERRLRNYYQQRGYFFAEVEAVCAVTPPFTDDDPAAPRNETIELCRDLSGADLASRGVTVSYRVDLNRRLEVSEIRITGTDELTFEDVKPVLESQEASLLGRVFSRFGYGRGYTSTEILEDDRQRLKTIMQQLGFRQAEVSVRQGVSPTGDNLIITFVVEEGLPTRIEDVDIVGNLEVPTARLEGVLPDVVNKNYSRARARNGLQKIQELYSNEGYYDAKINYAIVEVPDAPGQTEDRVKIVYTVENEGKKVFINRILVAGNEKTRRGAILKAITLEPNDVLRSTDIFTSEQNLYATDAFRRVEVKPEPAGEAPDGKGRQTDVIVNVEEQPPRIMTYGGGYSTDEGPFGLFDIRHVNLLGRLWQGGARIRMSRQQQLVQLDYLNPRFIREGKNRFAPLSITAQYQRDSTVTRFFRSTFDQGTFGIVQRIDEEGNPIDEFGAETATPTINRLNFAVETSRTINKETRSIVFLRYRFEDVRLYNIESLLIADLLRPDSRIRTSGFVATFVRDTRRNCTRRQTLLELIRTGEIGDACRYNASDPTHGSFLTFDYNVSLPALGANVGFNKFQANYQTYYTFGKLKKTTLAARVILGLGSVFSEDENRFAGPQFEALRGSLPISERFFAGGSTTLRGFEFEGAGPRVVVVPEGIFRNTEGEIVSLSPFTVPFGGNALAITNLEARVPFTENIQVVPFYDGGNVFRRASDIFKKPENIQNDVFRQNLRATWTHTVGLGIRVKTPIGGSVAVDYGYLLNPPQFLIPQPNNPPAIYRLKQGQLHFRFAQIF